MRQNILITGGLGFIGTNLIQRLLKTTNCNITIFDKLNSLTKINNLLPYQKTNNRVKVIGGDILNQKAVEKSVKNSNSIVHLAANTNTFDPSSQIIPAIITNVLGTTIVLEAALKYRVDKIIILSSSGVYGNKIRGIPMDENHPLAPINPYGASKLAADRIAYSFFLSNKLPVIILRPFNVYGPYQWPSKMIPLFITRLLKNLPISLNHEGKQERDWLYVEDLVDAIEMIIKAPIDKVAGAIFNLATGRSTSIGFTAGIILKKLNKNRKLVHIVKSSQVEVLNSIGISRRIKDIIGWTAKYTLDKGLDKTIQWYVNNRKWWDKSGK